MALNGEQKSTHVKNFSQYSGPSGLRGWRKTEGDTLVIFGESSGSENRAEI